MKLLDRLIQNSSFLVHKPAIIKRLLKNYTKSIIFKKNVLRTVDIVLDYNCNNSCSHCYAADFQDNHLRLLSLDQIFDVIDQCCAEGAIHFNIIGGEPTLNKDLFKLMDYINRKSALISLATNGSMIDADYARELKKHKLDVVLLSLDSIDKKEQDDFRGQGFYEKAMNALDNCLKVKLKVYISTVLTKDNMRSGSFKALERFCEERKLLLHVNLPALFGKWKDRDDFFLDEQEQKEIKDLYRGKYIRSCEMSTYFSSACRTGFEKLHITAYGEVMPCTFIPISFGNIKSERLGSIRARIRSFPYVNLHNELCIPSTNKEYYSFMQGKIKSASKLPIQFQELGL